MSSSISCRRVSKNGSRKNHLAGFVLDAVEQLDLGEFYRRHREDGWGAPAFAPKLMVALLLYAYCTGCRSSRRIEQCCREDVAYRVITANQAPGHATIARFRQGHEAELNRLFVQVLGLCAAAGMVRLGVVAVDGTKMAANASWDANRTLPAIEAEVGRMLAEAEATDAAEDREFGADRRGDELPEELRRRAGRLARLQEAKASLEARARQRQEAYERLLAERAAEEAARGRSLRGRKPKAPDSRRDEGARANVTGTDSRLMKSAKGYLQGYNAQLVVTREQIILAAGCTSEESDHHQLHTMLGRAGANLAAAGVYASIDAAVAGAGYYTDANALAAHEGGPELFIAIANRHPWRRALSEGCGPCGRIPRRLSLKERMARKLLTKRGQRLYAVRARSVEPVFGMIKYARGASSFLRRGLEACDAEWRLLATTHNMLKLWRRFTVQRRHEPQNRGRRSLALAA